ncbi:proline racemase family protein [Selenomonas sp.]|uniref:proline racemase family protein n=1 Tax=Selenomonas sp. TaxID=2053611 RepID=UPI002600B28A|nr:proline racemase family protein [Selenomonas sp.]MCI6284832.1 proline racemase family protein [Selenomonas sp.]
MQPLKKPRLQAYEYVLKTIDSHTEGESTRIVYDGFPALVGATMMEKKQDLIDHYDFLRRALMLEPRGHRDMFGAVLTEPVHKEADCGVIFLDSGGCLNMCGHGSIGTASMLVETGAIEAHEPYTDVVLDAPSGLIRTRVEVQGGHAVRASIWNVPAFLYRASVTLRVPEIFATCSMSGATRIPCDIAFGGSFFALVDADALGLPLKTENIDNITRLGMALRRAVNAQEHIQHPTLPITTVDLVEFYSRDCDADADLRNCVIFGDGQVDRSPCGTGTSAKMAALHAKGRLPLGSCFRYESITGSIFEGRPVRDVLIEGTTGGGKRGIVGIIPQITGSAHITGMNEWIIDERDALRYGFLIGKPEEAPAHQTVVQPLPKVAS